ncbi:aminopeptidase [Deferribacter abyssi]|uniref:aminopeptidase n=1 Tax=Deferribacter abyssi TaxID=213806 RepID=UPI003C28A9F0
MSYEEKLAKLLCDYSLKVKKGDLVEVRGEISAEPLIKACYVYLIKLGAYPIVKMSFPEQMYYFYKYAEKEQLEFIPEVSLTTAKTIDGLIVIDSEINTKQLTNVDSTKVAINRKATRILKDILFEREAKGEFKWVLAPYPTYSMAQDAEMSFEEYKNFVFGACKLNEKDPVRVWEEVSSFQEKIVELLTGGKELKILGKHTELILKVDGRKWINCNGSHNMPDGEVFTSPVEDSAEGVIFFDVPTTFMGVEVQNVTLYFEGGRVVKATAEKGEGFLNKMLDTDEGSRFIGEIAFGLNDSINKPTKNILFDEKIGKTIHLAVGSSYPEAGGKNKSGLHWDLIKKMDNGSEVYLDGVLVYKDGKFVF